MPGSVGRLKADLIANTAQFKAELGGAAQSARTTASELKGVFKEGVSSLGGPAGGLINAMLFGGPAGVAAKAAELGVGMLEDYLHKQKEIYQQARENGIGVGTVSNLNWAESITGAKAGSGVAALGALRESLTDVGLKSAGTQRALAELGLSGRRLADQSLDQTFDDVAGALAKIEDPLTRARIETQLMGSAARGMDQTLGKAAGYGKLTARQEMQALPNAPNPGWLLSVRSFFAGHSDEDVAAWQRQRQYQAQLDRRQDEIAEMRGKAQAITAGRGLLSPEEMFKAQLRDVREMVQAGQLSDTERARMASLAVDQMVAAGSQWSFAPAAEQGSVAAYGVWADALERQQKTDVTPEILETLKRQLDVYVDIRAILEQRGFRTRVTGGAN